MDRKPHPLAAVNRHLLDASLVLYEVAKSCHPADREKLAALGVLLRDATELLGELIRQTRDRED